VAKLPRPVIQADTPVPYAPDHTYGQLCHVRRSYTGAIQAGTLLAKDGAWDRKAVVAYVVYGGSTVRQGYTYHAFTVGLLALGRFYANGQLQPASAKPGVRELVVETINGLAGRYNLLGWCVVEPFAPPKAQEVIINSQHGAYAHGDPSLPLAGSTGPSAGAMHQLHQQEVQAQQAHLKKVAPSATPESILDQFIIRDLFAPQAAPAQQEQ